MSLTGAPTQEGDSVYFGLVGTNTLAGHEVVPFFDQNREQYLEYDLTSLVYRLANPQKPKLGVMSVLQLETGSGGLQAALAGAGIIPVAMEYSLRPGRFYRLQSAGRNGTDSGIQANPGESRRIQAN